MNTIHENNTTSFLAEVNAEENLTKTKVAEFAAKLIQLNTDGHVDTLTEAKTGVTRYGVTFKQKETAVKYDFSQTDVWNGMENEIERIKTAQKALEAQLKGLTKSMKILDEETGEITIMNPPIKSSKTTVEITLGK